MLCPKSPLKSKYAHFQSSLPMSKCNIGRAFGGTILAAGNKSKMEEDDQFALIEKGNLLRLEVEEDKSHHKATDL